MNIKIDEVKQSERVFRVLFPEIPKSSKSFKAFWREDNTPSASFIQMESGIWIIKDFASDEKYDVFRALQDFKSLTFKNSLELIGSQFPEFAIEPEKTPTEWARRRSINFEKLEIKQNKIEFKYFDWQNKQYIGSKFRNFDNKERFNCTKGLSLRKYFYHANLKQSKRLYILGGEGDCIAMSQRVSDPCAGISGEADRLPTDLIDCINFYKFEEICIYYDNPLYEPEKNKSQRLLAKELIKLESVNLVYGIDWRGFYFKDIGEASGAGLESFLKVKNNIERLEFKPIDEDIEVLKDEFNTIANKSQNFNLFEVLPARFASLFEDFRQCIDPNFPAEAVMSMFMSVVGGLMGTRFKSKEGYKESKAIIWTILSICSSSGKSDVLKFLTAPILKEEVALNNAHLREMEGYENALNQWRQDKKNTSLPKLPVRKRLMVETLTIESLRRDHSQNPDGLLVTAGEIAGLFASFGQYKNGKGDDRQAWLQFHSGEAILVSRVDTSKDISLEESAISIVGAIQPHILNKILSKDIDASDGLFSRFLYLDYEGYKLSEEPNKIFTGNTNLLNDFYQYIFALRENNFYKFEFDNTCEFKNNISVSFKKAQNQADNPVLHSYLGKQYNQFKALSLFFHILESFESKKIESIISLESQMKAAKMINLYLEHFKKILLRNSQRGSKLGIYQKIMQLKENEIKPSRLVSSNWAKDTKEALQIFEEMEKMDFGIKEKGKRGSYIFIKNEKGGMR